MSWEQNPWSDYARPTETDTSNNWFQLEQLYYPKVLNFPRGKHIAHNFRDEKKKD